MAAISFLHSSPICACLLCTSSLCSYFLQRCLPDVCAVFSPFTSDVLFSSFLFSQNAELDWTATVNLCDLCNSFSIQGINIVAPSNAEPPHQPPGPAMYQLDIILKKGSNLAIRDRTGRSSVCSSSYHNSFEFYAGRRRGQLHQAST